MVAEADGGHSRWHPLTTCTAPALVPGLPVGEFTVIGRCAPGARVERFPITALENVPPEDQARVAGSVDGWLGPILERLSRGELPPREFRPIEAGETVDAMPDEVLRPVDGPLWVSGAGLRLRGRAASRVLGDAELAPVGRQDWMVADGPVQASAHDTAALLADGRLRPALEATAGRALHAIRVTLASEEEAERDRVAARLVQDAKLVADTNRELADLMDGTARRHGAAVRGDDLLGAVALVADELGVAVRRPPPSAALGPRVDELAEIVRASGMNTREIRLARNWFQEDAGPMLGFLAEDERPVALVRRTFGYELRDPHDGSARRVTPAVAAELQPKGHAFYRQLPDRPMTGRELLRSARAARKRDLVAFLVSALAVAGLSLLVPLASGEILGTLVPERRARPRRTALPRPPGRRRRDRAVRRRTEPRRAPDRGPAPVERPGGHLGPGAADAAQLLPALVDRRPRHPDPRAHPDAGAARHAEHQGRGRAGRG